MELKAISPRTMADLRHVSAQGGRNLEASPPEISSPTANEINPPSTNERERPNLANNNEQISDNSASDSEHISNINFKRRKFLGILLWSGGAFLFGLLCRSFKPVTKLFPDHSSKLNSELKPPRKISSLQDERAQFGADLSVAQTGPSIQIDPPASSSMPTDKLASDEPKTEKETDFKNFKVVEKKDSMVFIDKKANEEVLILDWGAVDK